MKLRAPIKQNYLLILILLVAILLRFLAVKPGYNQYHGDETAIWGSTYKMVRDSSWDPGRYDYPATTMYINKLAFETVFLPAAWVKYYITNFGAILDGKIKLFPSDKEWLRVFDGYLIGERAVNAIFWTRYVTAVFGVGSVLLTYLLGKNLYGKPVGLLAALFVAINYRNVVNSHLALPDIYNAFFVLLSILTSWKLWQKPTKKHYLLAGLTAGFAFSVKYQVFSVFPFILAHFYFVLQSKHKLRTLVDRRFIAAGLAALVVFLVTNPYFFLNLETVVIKMNEEFIKYGMGTNSLNIFPFSYLYHIDLGPPLFVLALVGTLFSFIKFPKKTGLVMSVVLPAYYVFVYYSHGGFYVRNFITTTPILLIMAANILWTILKFLLEHSNYFGKLFSIGIVVVVIFVPAKNSILSTYGYTKPWGFDVLRPWVAANLPKDVVVAVHPFDRSTLQITNPTTEFDPAQAYSLAEHMENGANYVVADLNWASLPFYSWMNYSLRDTKKYWSKPLWLLRETFHGVAAEELFRYQVHVVAKPWQSPDTHFVIVKTPDWSNVELARLASYDFTDGSDKWSEINSVGEYGYDSEAGVNSGSLFSVPGARSGNGRIVSEPLAVKPGRLYMVSGYLRSDGELLSKERDGYLRVDFYSDLSDVKTVGKYSSVSARVFGTKDWVEKAITLVSPAEAKYMVVSFATYSSSSPTIWLDDVSVLESTQNVSDPIVSPPYTDKAIDLNYLYPNSHGNL